MKGFTLLELLVSVTIVGILSAIAIPAYNEYKKTAYDAAALSDLRSTAIAQESYHFDHDEYLSCQNESCLQLPGIKAISRGVNIGLTASTSGFQGTARHNKGTGKTYRWDSEAGGLVE